MFKKLGLVATLVVVFLAMSMLAFNVRPVRAEPRIWTVDDDGPADFHTIQEAVNASSLGDTVFVYNGTYHEEVLVNKTGISVIGENTYTTTIDGNVSIGDMYHEASYVTLASFSIDGRVYIGASSPGTGSHHDDIIRENFIKGGVSVTGWTMGSPYNISINENEIVKEGVCLGNCFGIVVCNNTIEDTDVAVTLGFLFGGEHRFHHNTFINNTKVLETAEGQIASYWDDGYPSGGNYWGDYDGLDADGDGIGETPYNIDAKNQDRYPLVVPQRPIPIFLEEMVYLVGLKSNSTISRFQFNALQKVISYNVTGTDGTMGFCNLTLPNNLVQDLWQGSFTVQIKPQEPIMLNNWTDGTYTYSYFTYQHSEHKVTIIPEFPSFAILLLFMIAMLLAAMVYRSKHHQKQYL
jgi:hypothetical protein